eukprot:Sro502_g155580.1 n/a (311) ;mRNA; r:32456-33388
MAHNFVNHPAKESTIWANCGASQFHLCYSPETSPGLPGRIGLRYDSLDGLQQRLQEHRQEKKEETTRCFQSFQLDQQDSQGNPQITIVDRYNNEFVCRALPSPIPSSPIASNQPILGISSDDEAEEWTDLAQRYGREKSDCRGIDYLEIACPTETAESIAQFYESVFDANTNVIPLPDNTKIAMIALGNIRTNGRADQYLLFKEQPQQQPDDTTGTTTTTTTSTQKQQHHIALYVGQVKADFNQAYRNAEMAGVVWINPRFEDKVDTLTAAQQWNQFRFKNIVDLETGKPIVELEHEVRSTEHSSWPVVL